MQSEGIEVKKGLTYCVHLRDTFRDQGYGQENATALYS